IVGQRAVPAENGEGAGGAARPLCGADQNDALEGMIRRFVLEPLDDGDRVIAHVLDRDMRGPRGQRQAIGDHHADGVVPKIAIADAADECAHAAQSSAPQAHVLTSRVITPASEWMCVVHGIHGSKLRMARRMSMPLNSAGSSVSSSSGVFNTASSYGPGWPHRSVGDAFHVEGVTIW